MKNYSLLALLAIMFAGCTANDTVTSALVFKNNMDGVHAWDEKHPANFVRTETAYSGLFVCKVNAESLYSTTFYMNIGDISSKNIKTMKVTGWIQVPDEAALPTLVVDFLDKDRQSFDYIAKDCREFIKSPNAWYKVTSEIDLTSGKRKNFENFVKVYFTNSTMQPLFVDDMTVEFEE